MLTAAVCGAFLVGLAAGVLRPLEPSGAALAAGLASLGALLVRRRPGLRWLSLAAVVALGAWWAGVRQTQPPDPLAELRGAPVVLEGEVATQPTRAGATTRFVLAARTRASSTGAAAEPIEARVDVVDWLDGPASGLMVGDRVRADGRLGSRTPGSSAGRHELAFPRLTPLAPAPGVDPRTLAPALRTAAVAAIHRSLADPEAALAAGLLLGGSGGLEPDFRQQLQRSGLSHLLAVDGYKQVLVAGALQVVAVRVLGRRLAQPVILLGITGYTLVTGASPSAVRAALMLGLSLVASLVGRVHDPLTGLLLAAAAMAGMQPTLLLDLAFQLSFAATLGLVLLYPRVRHLLRGVPRPIAEPAGLTLAVTVATLPVTLVVFQQISVVSPLAHVVAVPLVPAVLLGAGLLVLAQPIPLLASAGAGLCWLPAALLAEVVRVFGSLPGASLTTGHAPPGAAMGLAAGLVAWGVWELPDALDVRRRSRRALAALTWLPRLRAPLAVIVAGVLSSAFVLLVRPDGRLHITPLALHSGAALLVHGPGGSTALVVDGPVDPRELSEGVRLGLAVWERTLDLAVVVDPAETPRLGQVLQHYPASQVADASVDGRLDLGRGAVLDVFAAPVPEIRVDYGEVSVPLVGPSASAQDAEQVSDGSAVWTIAD